MECEIIVLKIVKEGTSKINSYFIFFKQINSYITSFKHVPFL